MSRGSARPNRQSRITNPGARRWALALIALLACPAPRAQAIDATPPDGAPGEVSLRLQRFGVEQGLSQPSARALAQDRDGILWIGTQDGLNRYDGEQFRIFRRDQQDASSLNDNHVTALLNDSHGSLWIGTLSGGVARYDADAERFRNFLADGPLGALAAVPVSALAEDAAGRLWVGSGLGHLQRFDEAQQRFETIRLPAHVQVRALLALPDGDVLIGSTDGLWRYGAKRATAEPWGDALAQPAPDVQALARAADGSLWIGTSNRGVLRLDVDGRLRERHDRASGLAGDDVRALLVDRFARVWIGTYTGLSRIDGPGRRARSWTRDDGQRDGLASERVHALLEDRDGLIWIGTWLGAVHLFAPASESFREFRAVPGEPRALPANAVRSILSDSDDRLWLGVQEGGGLLHFDTAGGVLQRFTPRADDPTSIASTRVQAIVRDADARMWIGFVDAGLDRMRDDGGGFDHFTHVPDDPTSMLGNDVLALHVDRAGTLWIGYQDSGLDALCRGCSAFEHHRYTPGRADGPPGASIGAIFESSRGELWVGARPGGLSRLDRRSGRFTPLESLLSNASGAIPRAITSISESYRGDLWIGTQGSGVIRLTSAPDGRLISVAYTHKEGMAADAVGYLVEDASGAIWASTTLGISRIDPASGRIENFNASSGAQSDGYFVNASARLSDGRIAFGGLRGVTLFDPASVAPRPRLRAPVVSDVRVFESQRGGRLPGMSYRRGRNDAADRLWLRAGSGGFGMAFSALAYLDPDSVVYSYRLDPIDPDWVEAGASQRNAGYPHLPPGNYTLRLRAHYPGEAFGPERRVELELDALWWQSTWARASLLLAILGALALFTWNRRERVLERARTQAVLAESEERLKLALWGTGDEFWDVDVTTGSLVRVNPLEHLEVSHAASEQTLRGYTPFVHEDDLAHFRATLQSLAKGEDESLDVVYRSPDVDGGWRWLRSRGRAVVRDGRGRALRMAGITQDITELREYEATLKRINQELEQRVEERTSALTVLNGSLLQTIEQLRMAQHQLVEAEKLAALGSLVAGIAHEINTPLGVGVTAASHLEQQARRFAQRLDAGTLKDGELEAFRTVVLECSAIVLRNLQRADKMIRSFKQVAVDQASEKPRRIDLRAYLDEILTSLQPALKRTRHKMDIDIPPNLLVDTYPGALYQIVTNLVMNAVTHAFGEGESGSIRIRARRDADALVFEFSDDGRGMSDDVRRHIFDPFFTTRRGQGGSGLGMHIVYNLATQMLGGSIECETAPGKGARFTLRLPEVRDVDVGR
jgi:ligand-binding sensor domain-containing protein/signal transduction histidine kinase